MHCGLLFHYDFLRQVHMEIYVKQNKVGKTNIKTEIINYCPNYAGKLILYDSSLIKMNNTTNIQPDFDLKVKLFQYLFN